MKPLSTAWNGEERFISVIDIWIVNAVPLLGFFFFEWGLSEQFFYFTFEVLFLWICALIVTHQHWQKYQAIHLQYFSKQLFWIWIGIFPILVIFTLNVYFEEGGSYATLGRFLWQFKYSIGILMVNTIMHYGRKWHGYGKFVDRIIEYDITPRFVVVNAYYGCSLLFHHFFSEFYTTHFLATAFWLFPLAKATAEMWSFFYFHGKKQRNHPENDQ